MSSDPIRVDDAESPPLVPSAWTIERVISAWQQFRAELLGDEELVEDENVIARALHASDLATPSELVSSLIDAAIWADRRRDEARVLAAEFTERARRYEARVERFRDLINGILTATETRNAVGRLARASIVRAPPSVLVTDEQRIPDEYFKVERTLRKSDVLADLKVGVVIDGAVLSNGGETLRLARLK